MSPFRSLASASRHFYSDPHLQQFLQRFATYNGSDPELTPATFAVIPTFRRTTADGSFEAEFADLRILLFSWLRNTESKSTPQLPFT